MLRRKPGKKYKGLKRAPFKIKPDAKRLKRGTTPLRRLGKQGKKWAKDRREKSNPEAVKAGINRCCLKYEGCWDVVQGHAHSLKRVNRTRPEHDWETIPTCNWCHTIAPWCLEHKGKDEMAKEVRRIRKQLGLPTWEDTNGK